MINCIKVVFPFFLTVCNFIVLKVMSDILCGLLSIAWTLGLPGPGLSSDKAPSTPVSQGEMRLRDLGAVPLCIWELIQNRLSKCSKPKVAHTEP